MSHTPGEWWYDEHTESIGCPAGWIGRVQHTQKADPPFGSPDDDGRLMASAPKLLKVCRHGRDALANLLEFNILTRHEYRAEAQELIDEIDAAIKAAEGEG